MKYLYKQFRALITVMLITGIPAVAIVFGTAFFALATGKHVWFFTEQPFILGHLPFYAGILSNTGILLWCASASICFFCAAILKENAQSQDWRLFLFISGIFTSLLLCDNLFQMHRIFYPKFLHLPTGLVYCIYIIFTLWYLAHFKEQILETEFLLLALSLIFFALSIIFDALPLLPRGSTAISDGLKLLGIVNWLVYFTRTCQKIVYKKLIIEDYRC